MNISTGDIFDITWNLASVMISLVFTKGAESLVLQLQSSKTDSRSWRRMATYHNFAVDVASDLKSLVGGALLGELLVQVVQKARRCFRENARLGLIAVVSGLVICTRRK